MQEADEVNRQYAYAFNNAENNTLSTRGQYGLPDITFTNKDSIVSEFEYAMQNDVSNIRNWISVAGQRKAFEEGQQRMAKAEFQGDFEQIARDIGDLARTV